jgi:hypothetical protein
MKPCELVIPLKNTWVNPDLFKFLESIVEPSKVTIEFKDGMERDYWLTSMRKVDDGNYSMNLAEIA